MTIHIFYRHYNTAEKSSKSRPPWFSYEKCFTNLLETIKDKDVKLNIVFDQASGNHLNDFIFQHENRFTLHEITAGNDANSFFQTWRLAKNQNIPESDLIYFLENDYLHVSNWVDLVFEFFGENPKDMRNNYLSLYDHNDKYFYGMYNDLTSKIFTTKNRHWRTTPSTCGSFIVNKNVFDLDFDVHSTVTGDHQKFLNLNSERGRCVITPIPSLSTHCMEGLMGPCIDWEEIHKNS